MKKTFLIILTLALLLSFSSCREKSNGDDEGFGKDVDIEILEEDSLNVILLLPDTWTESSSSYQGTEIRHYTSPSDGKGDVFSESISITTEALKEETTLEAYTSANVEIFKRIFNDFKMISEAETITLGGVDGMRVVYSYTAGAIHIVIDQTFVINDGKAYMITCNATEDSYAEYSDIFSSAIESFKIS
ncbi:MAG: DcrB-related protein [Clostridia bacterium]|nr:DcrB-related protein [Clostridia bacterium]